MDFVHGVKAAILVIGGVSALMVAVVKAGKWLEKETERQNRHPIIEKYEPVN